MAEKIARKNWSSRFSLTGRAVITNFAFEIDKKSAKSNYVFNRMRLGIDCGENHGTVWTELMGGYSVDNPRSIRKPSINKEDNSPNYDNQVVCEWENRLDPEVVDMIHPRSLFTVGLKRTTEGNVYEKKFVSEYDAIAYIKSCLEPGMVVNVWGNLEYSTYNGNTTVRKNVVGITLANSTNPSDFKANFTQSILIDKESASINASNIDKDKGVMFVNARVLNYVSEINGHKINGQYPFTMQFEQTLPKDANKHKAFYDLVYKVNKGITQVNMEGEFVESGAVIKPTLDDLTPDVKALYDLGVFTEDEALAKCSTNGNVERRMVLTKPVIRDGAILKFEEQYEEDDLVLDCMFDKNEDNEIPFKDDGRTFDNDDDMGWLDDMIN